jgi:hypothetical protein
MSMAAPLGGATEEFGSAHHQRLEMSMMGPLGVLPENLGAPTTNVKKRQ